MLAIPATWALATVSHLGKRSHDSSSRNTPTWSGVERFSLRLCFGMFLVSVLQIQNETKYLCIIKVKPARTRNTTSDLEVRRLIISDVSLMWTGRRNSLLMPHFNAFCFFCLSRNLKKISSSGHKADLGHLKPDSTNALRSPWLRLHRNRLQSSGLLRFVHYYNIIMFIINQMLLSQVAERSRAPSREHSGALCPPPQRTWIN